jgi:hypothetical protein
MRLKRVYCLVFLLSLIVQFFMIGILPSPAHAERISDYDWLWVAEQGTLKIIALRKGEDTPRSRSVEFPLRGNRTRGGDAETLFGPAKFFNEQAKEDLNISGDLNRQYSIWIKNSAPRTGYFVDQNNDRADSLVVRDIGNPSRYNKFIECRRTPHPNTAALDKCVADSAQPDPAEEDTNDEAEQDSCDVQVNNVLSWIICPVMQLAEGAVNMFATRANDALCFEISKNRTTSNDCEEVDPLDPNSKDQPPEDTETPLYEAWSNIRNIANVLFVISLLGIVISQLVIGKM